MVYHDVNRKLVSLIHCAPRNKQNSDLCAKVAFQTGFPSWLVDYRYRYTGETKMVT